MIGLISDTGWTALVNIAIAGAFATVGVAYFWPRRSK